MPQCFTCNVELDTNEGYLATRSDGTSTVIPVCDECRIRHAREGRAGSDYLMEDRMAHGLPPAGIGIT